MDYSEIIRIVREAAKLMITDCFEISQKEGFANIVTSSDIAVQEFLVKELSTIFPGSGFFCEEEDCQDDSHEYTWIIDPIDGTANYSRGIDQCAISVALKHNSQIIFGVVYLPRTQELFYAELGKGAYLNDKQIHVSDRKFENGVMCTALPVYYKEYAPVCSEIIRDTFLKCNDIRRFGAAAPEICYLAMGRCELYFEYILSPWDFAAASLILTEAGGCITNKDHSPIIFNKKIGIIAANSIENLKELQSIIDKHLK